MHPGCCVGLDSACGDGPRSGFCAGVGGSVLAAPGSDRPTPGEWVVRVAPSLECSRLFAGPLQPRLVSRGASRPRPEPGSGGMNSAPREMPVVNAANLVRGDH